MREQLALFDKLSKELDDLYHQFAKFSGLSDCAFWILYTIQENGKVYKQKDLCELWSFSKQTINSALKVLEKKGLITLASIPENKKDKQIVLTEQGNKMVVKQLNPFMKAEEVAFEKLGENEREQLLKITGKFIELLKKETDKIMKGENN